MALVVFVVFVPYMVGDARLYQFCIIALYAVVALGMDIAIGYGGQFLLAQPFVLAVAGYTATYEAMHWSMSPLAALPLALVFAVAAGVLLGLPGIRLTGFHFAAVSFFAVMTLPDLATVLSGITGGANGIVGLPPLSVGGHVFSTRDYFWLLVGIAVVIFLVFRAALSLGWELRFLALRDAPNSLRTVGISGVTTKLVCYSLSSIPAALAGWVIVYLNQSIQPGLFDLTFLIIVLAGVELGGRATLIGPLLGSLLIGGYSQAIGPYSVWNSFGLGAVLIVVIVIFPGGLSRLMRPRLGAVSVSENLEVTGPLRLGHLLPTVERSATSGLLEVRDLCKSFSGMMVLDGISLRVGHGEIVGLVGANGSGKTTFLNVVSGLVRPDSGSVRSVASRSDVGDGYQPLVMSRTFQIPQLVPSLSARRNIEIGLLRQYPPRLLLDVVRPWTIVRRRKRSRRVAYEICEALGIAGPAADVPVERLPLGLHRIVEVGRALSTGAELLCLDEPAAGLTPTEIDALGRVITAVRDTGRSVLLIEHHLSFVTDICDRVVLLARGHVSAEETLGESRTLSTPELIDYFTKTDSVTVAPSDAIDVATTGTEDVR